jgi:hypothetical protein
LSSAFETQGAELEALRLKLAEVEKEASTAAATAKRSRMESAHQVVALTDQAHTASARALMDGDPTCSVIKIATEDLPRGMGMMNHHACCHIGLLPLLVDSLN